MGLACRRCRHYQSSVSSGWLSETEIWSSVPTQFQGAASHSGAISQLPIRPTSRVGPACFMRLAFFLRPPFEMTMATRTPKHYGSRAMPFDWRARKRRLSGTTTEGTSRS
jgi:hypothetical protein